MNKVKIRWSLRVSISVMKTHSNLGWKGFISSYKSSIAEASWGRIARQELTTGLLPIAGSTYFLIAPSTSSPELALFIIR